MTNPSHRLLNLLRGNAGAVYNFDARAAGDEATIYLHGPIFPMEDMALNFSKSLSAITAKTIHLRVNSPGGEVFEARAIATAVSQHPSKIIAHVDGLAASAASLIVVAAAEVEIADGAMMMIHRAHSIALGDADDMLAMAELLEKVDGQIVDTYHKKTGKDKKALLQMMADTTFFTAQEAVDAKLADRVSADSATNQAALSARSRWNLTAYHNVPAALKEAPKPAPQDFDHAAQERRFSLYERIGA